MNKDPESWNRIDPVSLIKAPSHAIDVLEMAVQDIQELAGTRDREWNDAFTVACDAVDLIPCDREHTVHRFAAETVARALYKAMLNRNMPAIWPERFGCARER